MKVFSVRLEDDLHEELRIKSFNELVSMNEIIVEAIKEKLEKESEE